jgi:hypothetical protein
LTEEEWVDRLRPSRVKLKKIAIWRDFLRKSLFRIESFFFAVSSFGQAARRKEQQKEWDRRASRR